MGERNAARLTIAGAGIAIALLLSACSGQPAHGAASPGAGSRGSLAWVATGASVTRPGSDITPVDLATRSVEPAVDLAGLPAAASRPSAMAFADGGADLLVASEGDDMLIEIDAATRQVRHSVTVGLEPDAMAVVPGGTGHAGVALVANLGGASVTPVDLGTWKAGPPIAVGTEPVAIAVAGTTAFVADFGSNEVTPIDMPTRRAGAPIAVGSEPQTLAVAGGEVLVGNFGNSTLTAISTTARQPGAAVALPIDPTGIAVAASGATAYISGGASVVPLTVAGLAVGSPIRLPGVAEAIALTPDGTTAWVALQSGSLIPLTLPSGRVGRAVHVGGHPSAVVFGGSA